jgi:hypothetical protein
MGKWKEQLTPDCPRCRQIENARHVWLCPEIAVYFVWTLLISSFSDWLASIHPATQVTYWNIQRLTKWRSQAPFSTASTDLPGLLQVIEAQDIMGWLALHSSGMGRHTTSAFSVARMAEYRQTLGYIDSSEVMGDSLLGSMGPSQPDQAQPATTPSCLQSALMDAWAFHAVTGISSNTLFCLYSLALYIILMCGYSEFTRLVHVMIDVKRSK